MVTNTGLDEANSDGNVQDLANLIFSRYVFAFEVTSALLITAALGAMILAHRERHEHRPNQRELPSSGSAAASTRAAARSGRLRTAQRRRHAGAAPRRQRGRGVAVPVLIARATSAGHPAPSWPCPAMTRART